MGIVYPDAKRLWAARQRGVSFQHTATLGHQSLYLHPHELRWFRRSLAAAQPASNGAGSAQPLASYRFGDYSDEFLKTFLGVESLTVIDNSAYEGAQVIHDMNVAVPESLVGRFDVVIDGGTLEHVFNFPTAVSNVMRMVKVGGTAFITTPANNLCGHGFYQFSPELMFRVFTKANGFELREVLIAKGKYPGVELVPMRRVYQVTDPSALGARVGLMGSGPALMMVEAVKTADVPLFATAPQQSDYVVAWNGDGNPGAEVAARPDARRKLKNWFWKLPPYVRNRVLGLVQVRQYSLSNKRAFARVR